MSQPPGFEDRDHPDYVCHLHKSLYGLKQAPCVWFHRLSEFLLGLGFVASKTDSSLFILRTNSHVLYVLIYVDDILVTSNDSSQVSLLLRQFATEFSIKDLGDLHFFLGIEAVQNFTGLLLSQTRYIRDLLSKAGMIDCKPVQTPMAMTQGSDSGGAPYPDPTQYRSIVRALQYVTLTRPDISFAVNKVCQFMQSPSSDHWVMIKCILRYLQATADHGLQIQRSTSRSLQASSDADWAGSGTDRHSTGGYAIFFSPNLISWASRKQKIVARSSTESEYKALADASAELIWLESLFQELGYPLHGPSILWCDNIGATYFSINPVFHARTKHVEIDFHFVREHVARHQLSVQFISTQD
uniref:Uncharacterized protein LOC109506121 n=1 Tax=Elaeis guineensis var. tenera TaxID=51953 RepID=A0A6J0PM32_ELAGV|nr:uncharacterized protein LOC109506121 [Elaeis guineensis]